MRSVVFANNQYYHIYNRGVDKRKIFMNKEDYNRFLLAIKFLNQKETIGSIRDFLALQKPDSWNSRSRASGKPLVDIVVYCLLPNHYHFILKQLQENGISAFLHRLGTSYSNYFNRKYKRSGVLFQGKFKAKHIDSDEYLIWLSAYIHMNSEIHRISKASNYKYSNYNTSRSRASGRGMVLDNFKTLKDYQKYCQDLVLVWQNKKAMQKYILESP